MKNGAAALALILSGCGAVQWVPTPEVSESACTSSCNAHFDQCPQIFAKFPERGAIECPAERNICLKACASARAPARTATTPLLPPSRDLPAASAAPPSGPASSARPAGPKEERLRELKHFYEEGLVTEDVYRDQQKAILAEP